MMVPDTDELLLFEDSHSVGETYIFEPAGTEAVLGWLFAAAEVKLLDGIGKDLIETVIQALQKEYYRDPKRGVLVSFESALHQANLVLHDLSEQGVREWMSFFNVAVGVLAAPGAGEDRKNLNKTGLASMTLHVSTAGDGVVLLGRARNISVVSAGLSRSPVTDPLRTFSSVASGVATEKDLVFFGTSNFDQTYSNDDLVRFASDQSAETVSIYLSQLYEDQKKHLPVAAVIAALTANENNIKPISKLKESLMTRRDPVPLGSGLTPRKPLAISSSISKRVLLLIGKLIVYAWGKTKQVIWPFLKEGSRKGGKAIFVASKSASRKMRYMKDKQASGSGLSAGGTVGDVYQSVGLKGASGRIKYAVKTLISNTKDSIKTLPRSGKIFGVLAIILTILLGVSVVLLQKKRAADAQIQHASETLHEARTKKEAADTALIYDNRDQARALLIDADRLIEEVALSGLYQEQTKSLMSDITHAQDRLDKVTRVSEDSTRELGDMASAMPGAMPTKVFYLDGAVYSFDPKSNIIARMNEDGAVEKVSNATSGIGFFTKGSTHEADKSIVLITQDPGLAIFDAKTSIVQKQEIQMPASQSELAAVATFGNRIYLLDKASGNIFGYSKTLRGYSGGNAWITDNDFPANNIIDIGVDGYVYTLHGDGTVRKLLKGEEVDFKLETLETKIAGNATLLINEELRHLYIFDPANKRVVIFDTVGNLTRQIFLGEDSKASDITVDADETSLYVLDGTRVLMISLGE